LSSLSSTGGAGRSPSPDFGVGCVRRLGTGACRARQFWRGAATGFSATRLVRIPPSFRAHPRPSRRKRWKIRWNPFGARSSVAWFWRPFCIGQRWL